MDRRRSSIDPNSSQAPPKKIVGFHVEGVAPSPVHHTGLLADHNLQGTQISGSPNPVIIPPSFQTDSPLTARGGPFSPHAAAVGSAPTQDPMLSPDRPPAHMDQAGVQNPGRDGLTPTQSLPPPQDGQLDLRSVLDRGQKASEQGASVRGEVERTHSYLSRTSAPMPGRTPRQQWPGQGTPSAPTTPLTSPVHPDSSEGTNLSLDMSLASRRSHSLGDHLSTRGSEGAWDRSAATAVAAAAATQRPPPSPTYRGAAGEVSSRGPEDKAAAQSSAAVGKPAAPAAEAAQGAGRQLSQQDESRKAPSRAAAASPRPAPPSSQSSSTAAPPAPAKQQAAPRAAPQQAGGPDARPDPRGPKPTNRAERRALQEAQKAAKAATRGEPASKGATAPAKKAEPAAKKAPEADHQPPAPAPAPGKSKHGRKPQRDQQSANQALQLFSHLQQYREVDIDSVMTESEFAGRVHPTILRLGLAYASGAVRGSNARAVALLTALSQMFQEYVTPEGKVLSRDLTHQLNTAIQFLVECRPLSVSMGNAIKFVKLQVSKVDPGTPQEDAKQTLIEKIDTYIQEKIVFADDMLVKNAVAKIDDGDVILTYGYSSTVFAIFMQAQQDGKRFKVVAADARPHLEGRVLRQRLIKCGIACTYILLNAVACVIPEVSKVFLGAASVLSNGTVMSRAGSAAVAMLAAAHRCPVLVCCETYKFHERVQLDSITQNELGNPDDLVAVPLKPEITTLKDWRTQPHLGVLNLIYDAMPSDFVTLIVTEFGLIPPTSVPVILREYRQEPAL
ncbi:hypothetical protein CVIRNUC_007634 [Coccomyxa viridis]|uniref:Translation initiation factor eIF2B subunit delta n=1 Tax=Coccomyxa viridis TaxID=1274662 RepID=A0AAV1IEK9_9CHLO|nr:hypothetical protein CVIRNUC_007634 [Coccomyxa viridis]